MCKVLIVPGIKKANMEATHKFIKAIAKPMSRANTDGLGYTAMTYEGKMFGERWLNNDKAFTRATKPMIDSTKDILGEAVMLAETYTTTEETAYNSYGELDLDNMAAITLHTRYATSPKGMQNTHPFVDEGVSLIHNGVIRNHDKFELKSTCDSEAILRVYINEKVYDDVGNAQAALEQLVGYYACGVLSNKKEPVLDIFKSTGARLHAIFVQELDTCVISTESADIKEVCKDLGFTMGSVFQILPNKFIRVNPLTGQTVSITDFKPGAEYTYVTQHSNWKDYDTPKTALPPVPVKKTADVYPFGKKRNSIVSDGLMHYFRAGTPQCVKLNERDLQDTIIMKELALI